MIPLPVPAVPAAQAHPNREPSGAVRTVSSVLRRHIRRRKLRWYR